MQELRRFGFLSPATLWTIAFFVAPLGVMVTYSFWQYSESGIIKDWSVDNYSAFFTRPQLVEALQNSLEVAAITTVVSVLVAYPVAYILAYYIPKKYQRLALVAAILPFWTSYLVRSYSWLLVLSKNGIINHALLAAGLISDPLAMGHGRFATVLGLVHFFSMLLTLTIFANLIQIPKSYRAAAADLGASPFEIFMRVTLPLSIPGVAVGCFLTFVIAIGDYITPHILGGGRELLMPQAIMLQVSRHFDYPMASALSVLLMIVVTIVFLAFARWLKMDRI